MSYGDVVMGKNEDGPVLYAMEIPAILDEIEERLDRTDERFDRLEQGEGPEPDKYFKRPCPFCGEPECVTSSTVWQAGKMVSQHIRCQSCEAAGPIQYKQVSERDDSSELKKSLLIDAIALWNKRGEAR